MKRLGLNMDIGVGLKPSKTEAIFLPQDKIQNCIQKHEKSMLSFTVLPISNLFVKSKTLL